MRAGRWLWAALAALALWHLALRWHGLALPLTSDEGEYAYEARVLAEGGVPYRDAYDQKPPMVFFLYRLAYAFSDEPGAPRVLALLFSWAAMLILFLLAPTSWSAAARLTAPALFGAMSTAPIGGLGFAANSEVFVCAFLAFAALALRRSWEEPGLVWPLAAGLAAGTALMTKQTCLWTALAFGVLAAWDGRGLRWRRGGPYLCGLAVAPCLIVVYFQYRGGLEFLLEQALRRNLHYSSVMAPALGGQLAWLASTLWPLLALSQGPAWALAGYGLKGIRAGWQNRHGVLIVAWLGTAAAGAMTGLFFFPHYFLPMVPALAAAGALGLSRLKRLQGLTLAGLCLYPVIASGRSYFLDAPQDLARRLLYPNPLYEALPVADHIRKNSTPEETAYVFGSEPQIYVYARRRCATRHIFSYPLTLFPEGAAAVDQELKDLKEKPPRFVVWSAWPASTLVASRHGARFLQEGRDWVEKRYKLVKGVGSSSRAEGPQSSRSEGLLLFERLPVPAPKPKISTTSAPEPGAAA